MTISYQGVKTASDEAIRVDMVPWDPSYCRRGYTSCAPKGRSWTCNNQIFVSKALVSEIGKTLDVAGKQGTKLSFHGLQIQPFYGNEPKIRFGEKWDCDSSALISFALNWVTEWGTEWVTEKVSEGVTFLLSLALIFALLLSWDILVLREPFGIV